MLRTWFNFYDLYDPKFSWWVDSEYKKADEALGAHAQFLHTASGFPGLLDTGIRGGGREGSEEGEDANPPQANGPLGSNEELSGIGPAGNDALVEALEAAMIAYTPDELIALANREFAWCDREMLRASSEMGFGNDWKKALEAVKNKYVEPGQMIYLVRDLSREAIEFVEKHELVTIPPLVKEDYWEEAMTPQMQLVTPFFTGGATIQVSSPASSQTLQERLESPARQQHVLRPRHGVPRADSRPPHADVHDPAVPHLPRPLQHAVLDRGHGVLLGDAAVGPGLHAHARAARGRAGLEDAPVRAHHLLAELPPGQDDRGGVRASS